MKKILKKSEEKETKKIFLFFFLRLEFEHNC